VAVDFVSGNPKDPAPKSTFISAKPAKMPHHLQEGGGRNVFGGGSIQQAVNAIAENSVVMAPIEFGEGFRITPGSLHQCLFGWQVCNLTRFHFPQSTGTLMRIHHRYKRCSPPKRGKKSAGSEDSLERLSKLRSKHESALG
jgi:hypothetical protein